MSLYKVTATSLHIRKRPIVSSSTKLATLPQGHVVDVLNKEKTPWWFVATEYRKVSITGYVHSSYLIAESNYLNSGSFSSISAVHLAENKTTITRDRDGGRAFPLGEQGKPSRNASDVAAKVDQIGKIINWLRVESSERYLRNGSTTYCNIYAYDLCYLAGVYIPRVWWKPKALLDLNDGRTVDVLYGETVTEMNANSLHDWFDDFGQSFGWSSIIDLNEAQAAANKGKIVIVCAKRVTTNRPGHICAIVPETTHYIAARNSEGVVTKSLQSQAGGNNYRYKSANMWWTDRKFQSFGIWVHE